MSDTALGLPQQALNVFNVSEDSDSDGQVDTISTASCQDEENQHTYATKDVLAVSSEQTPPYFQSVSVVNSNDVHFGNKTVYKGPVTIKQFVYPNGIKNVGYEDSGGNDKKNGDICSPAFVNKEESEQSATPQTGDSSNPSLLQRINKGTYCVTKFSLNKCGGSFIKLIYYS